MSSPVVLSAKNKEKQVTYLLSKYFSNNMLLSVYGLLYNFRHELSTTSKRKKLEELNNAAVVSQPATKKFDICPKTGRLIPRFNFVPLPDRVRRAHFKKQGSLLVQAVRRCMLQGRMKNSSCCFKRCFRRRPKL